MAKTYTGIKTEIANDITGKTEAKSITKTAVGGAIGDVLDYANDAVRLRHDNTIYLSDNIISANNADFDELWSVDDDVISFDGGSTSSYFEFSTTTDNGARYFAEITQHSGTLENAFYLQIGNTPDVDAYNGKINMNCGFFSDGGKLKIKPRSGKKFSISLTLKKIVPQSQSTNTATIYTDNVDAGNLSSSIIDGKWNVAIGPSSVTMANNVNGSRSVAIGYNSLYQWKSGLQNIGIGSFALSLLESGSRNIAIGSDSCWQIKTGDDNICIGKGTLGSTGMYNNNSRNTVIGSESGSGNTASSNDATIIGYKSGRSAGARCVYVGSQVAQSASMGEENVGIGYRSLTTAFSNGSKNVAIGCYSGINGRGSGSDPKTIDNSVAIGYNTYASKSNQIMIGSTNHTEVVLMGNKKLSFNADGSVTWESV